MLSCNGIMLNYANLMYDKSDSKIQLVCDTTAELSIEVFFRQSKDKLALVK